MSAEAEHLRQLLATAQEAALLAADVILDGLEKPHQITRKANNSIVTETDRKAQDVVHELLRRKHPRHTIISEEDPETHPQPGQPWHLPPGIAWIIDPIDGTTNFARALPFFCVSIGAALDGEPVVGAIYDPMREEMFLAAQGLGATLDGDPLPRLPEGDLRSAMIASDWGRAPGNELPTIEGLKALAPRSRSQRVLGSAALGLAYVAAGRIDLYLNFGSNPWDVAAGAVLVRECGGELHGHSRPWRLGQPDVIAAPPGVLRQALAHIAEVVG